MPSCNWLRLHETEYPAEIPRLSGFFQPTHQVIQKLAFRRFRGTQYFRGMPIGILLRQTNGLFRTLRQCNQGSRKAAATPMRCMNDREMRLRDGSFWIWRNKTAHHSGSDFARRSNQ